MQPLQESLGDKYDQVEFVAADLTDPESIDKAIEGCEYVVHTASPFPANVPKNEDDVIKPAVEGKLNLRPFLFLKLATLNIKV